MACSGGRIRTCDLSRPSACASCIFRVKTPGDSEGILGILITVGMALAGHPPHRSRRAELPHRAPASGTDVLSRVLRPHVFGRAHGAGLPGIESRTWFARPNFPWPSPFPPDAPPGEVPPASCSRPSLVVWACLTSRYRSSWLYFNS